MAKQAALQQTASDQIVNSSISADQQARLDAIAANIRKRFRRLFQDIYDSGKELIEAKAVFGWGQTPAFLEWAQEKTGLSVSLCYYMMAVARAFLPFEQQGTFSALNQVDATLLYRIASDSTPKSARTIFVEQVLAGNTWTSESIEALIQQHQQTVDLEQDERFLRYREEVQNWGRLEQCIEDESYRFYLIDRANIVRFFRNYQDPMTQYKVWKAQVFQEQLSQLRELLTPHWSIEHRPVPKQPFRLSVNSTIKNKPISFVVPNPVTLERWWNEKGQELTDRLLASGRKRRSSQATSLESEDFSIEKPTCLNCHWHDPQHEGNRFGVWCGFYRETISDDRITAMPQHCRKWSNSEVSDEQALEFQTTRQFLQTQPNLDLEWNSTEPQTISTVQEKQYSVGATIEVASISISNQGIDAEFEAILQYIQHCTEDQLSQLELAIASRRNASKPTSRQQSRTTSRQHR
ncbi:hypothetical protein ACQ4M3_37950 [Leptolyngbya sp. AN03gr2]|uniref:hypothetical protein n=1 Tax=unclassified Leptolyngbya TaxID=2650499 RepID=UPI003D3100CD